MWLGNAWCLGSEQPPPARQAHRVTAHRATLPGSRVVAAGPQGAPVSPTPGKGPVRAFHCAFECLQVAWSVDGRVVLKYTSRREGQSAGRVIVVNSPKDQEAQVWAAGASVLL